MNAAMCRAKRTKKSDRDLRPPDQKKRSTIQDDFPSGRLFGSCYGGLGLHTDTAELTVNKTLLIRYLIT
eukprot:4014738-Pyramimonas_sp.AAC.1